MLVNAGLNLLAHVSGGMASSSTDCSPKVLARESDFFVGRVGKSQASICHSCTARHSKWISLSGGSRFHKDQFKPLAAAGLPHMRFHELRHASAALLLSQGVPPKSRPGALGGTRRSA